MPTKSKTNLILGVSVVGFSLILIFVWVPLDTTTAIMGVMRRRPFIGDAMAPTVAGLFLLLGGALVAIFERKPAQQPGLDGRQIRFVTWVAAFLAIGFLIMSYAGPLAVASWSLISGDTLSYRSLRGTAPWKYIGFFLGGSFSVTAITALTERRLGVRHVLIGMATSILLILVFDVPFEDLLLPPNGDF
jgi:hypothetical protein